MKNLFKLSTLFAASAFVTGAPLVQTHVAADAKWLLHVDVHEIRNSQMGTVGIEQMKTMLEKEMGPIGINIDALLQEIESITAYGTSYERDAPEKSVLMISAGDKAQAMIEGYIAHETLTKGDAGGVQELRELAYQTYLIDGQIYMAFPTPRRILISQSLDKIMHAQNVVDGRATSLLSGDSVLSVHDDGGFFVLASVQGLNQLKDMPPQARILSKATGGQVAFGESNGEVKASVILTTETDEIARQLSRIIEGMVALASFVEVDGYGVARLVESIDISSGDKKVQMSLRYPTDDLLLLIELAQKSVASRRSQSDAPREENDFEFTDQETTDAVGGEELAILQVSGPSKRQNPPSHAIDLDTASYWAAKGKGQALVIELEEPALVREIQIDWIRGHLRKARFRVEVSDDGKIWRPLVDKISSGESYTLESFNIPDVTTKWIRIKGFGNTENDWNSIKELKLLGEEAAGR